MTMTMKETCVNTIQLQAMYLKEISLFTYFNH